MVSHFQCAYLILFQQCSITSITTASPRGGPGQGHYQGWVGGWGEAGGGGKGWKTTHYSVCSLEQNRSRDGNKGLERTPENFRTHSENEQTLKLSFICTKLHQVISTSKDFSKSSLRSELLEILFGAYPSSRHLHVHENTATAGA